MHDSELPMDEQIRNKNKKKLVQQNVKLIAELKHLQIEIEALGDANKDNKEDESALNALKNEGQAQQREIKKLKELIQAEKHANPKENVIYIRKEEDELIYLKKQLQNLQTEKSLVVYTHSDKVKKLTNNEPLQKHKQELQTLWAKTKKQNRQLNLKMVELQREVRKYHNIKQIAKGPQPETTNYNDNEILITIAEIERINAEMKSIQSKWKSNIEQLDKEFFTNKTVLNNCQHKIQELEREEEIWKRRAGTLRDQTELASDRARLSKIVPIKNSEEVKTSSVQNKIQRSLSKNTVDDLQTMNKVDRMVRLAASLSRAESSPNPPTSNKHSVEVKLNDLLIPGNKLHRYNTNKQRAQTSIGLINLQKAKELKLKEVMNSQRKAQILNSKAKQKQDKKIVFKEQVVDQKGKMNHREKHRIKSSAAAQLAESLKRKAEEVKELNKKLQTEQLKTNKGKKPKDKQTKIQVIQIETSPKNAKSKSKVQKQPQTLVHRQAIANSPLKKQKSQSSIKQNEQKDANLIPKPKKVKQLQSSREQSKSKQKQLVQNLQLQTRKQHKQQHSSKNSVIVIAKNGSYLNNKQKVASPYAQQKAQVSPVSPTKESKKDHSILQQKSELSVIIHPQLQRHKSPSIPQQRDLKLNLQIELQDQDDDKPKIIRRKRPVQNNLVTTGTST